MDPKSRLCQQSGSSARTFRKDDHGRIPIRLRISHRGEKRFTSLPVKVPLGKWNGEKRRVTETHPDAEEINAFLSDLERAAFSVTSRLERAGTLITAQRIKDEIQEEREEGKSAPKDFPALAREKVKGYKRREQINPPGPTGSPAASSWRLSKKPTDGRKCSLERSKRSCFESFGPTATRSGAAVRTPPSASCLSCARSCGTQ